MPLLVGRSQDGQLRVQTLARFGRHAVCTTIATDRQGNVYLDLYTCNSTVLLMLEAGSNRVVQLAQVSSPVNALAVTPNGQALFVLLADGRLIRFSAPFANAEPEQFRQRFRGYAYFMYAEDNTLWLMDDERVLHKMDVQGSNTDQIPITDQWYDLVLCSSSGGQLVMYGVICGEDYSWQVIRVQADGTSSSCTPVQITWPDGLDASSKPKQIMGCSKEGALLIAAAVNARRQDPQRPSWIPDLTAIFHVSPAGQATLVADVGSRGRQGQDDGLCADMWEGFAALNDSNLPPDKLSCCTLNANGHIVGFTTGGLVLRVELSMSVPPAHLQPEPVVRDNDSASNISFASSESHQLAQDWGALLASGQGADVQLRCAGGAVVSTHSAVLLARCEYYRALHRTVEAGMTGSVVGEVDVGDHSAATISLVLQHLYSGRVELTAAAVEEQEQPGPSSTAGPSALPPSSLTPGGQQPVSRAASLSRPLQIKLDGKGSPTKAGEGSSGSLFSPRRIRAPLSDRLAQLLHLMRAADALLLPDLHAACLDLVQQQQLSPGNALPLLLAAHEAQLGALEDAVLEYTVKHVTDITRGSSSPLSIEAVAVTAPLLGGKLAAKLAAALAGSS